MPPIKRHFKWDGTITAGALLSFAGLIIAVGGWAVSFAIWGAGLEYNQQAILAESRAHDEALSARINHLEEQNRILHEGLDDRLRPIESLLLQWSPFSP